MIVAIDTLFMSKRFSYTGTGVYLSHLLSACLKLAEAFTPGVEFHGFIPPDEDWANNGFVSPFFRLHRARSLARKSLWAFGGLALHTSRVRPDVVFLPTPHHSVPGRRFPVVTTIHDAMPHQLPPRMVDRSGRTFLRAMTWLNEKMANKVITVSGWSRQALIECYGLAPEKVKVIYNGFDRQRYNPIPPDPGASAALLARLGVRRPFALHHGMVQLRKNLHRLIQAWDRAMEGNKSFDAQLVMAGPMGPGYQQILQVRESSPNRRQIVFTGALSQADLATLVKNATLCVIPSLCEGFCFPMVEAMACGVPTVAANSSCLPEVSGGTLEYFDPCSIEEMAQVIRQAMESSSLRDRLRQNGLARAGEFSWERCARETLRVFAEASAAAKTETSRFQWKTADHCIG